MDVLESSRARRLRAGTGDMHERLDRQINAASAFDNISAYGRFVQMQWVFHAEIAPLYADPALQAALPGLAARQRLALVAGDMTDLDLAPIVEPDARFSAGRIDTAEALGWLYVAEGSNMGAALLRKAVARFGLSDGHGGRHLTPAAEGPAAQWRKFVAALDTVDLDDTGEERALQGARAAFARVERLAELHFA